MWGHCRLCPLHKTRSNVVLARGELPCDYLFIGEAPGPQEDANGWPFVGRSGELLDAMITDLIKKVGKISYAITNAVACFPHTVVGIQTESGVESGYVIRPPDKAELKACQPRLADFMNIARPKTIILLGKSAVKAYKSIPSPIGVDSMESVLELQHPSFILRNGGINSVAYVRNLLRLKEFIESQK